MRMRWLFIVYNYSDTLDGFINQFKELFFIWGQFGNWRIIPSGWIIPINNLFYLHLPVFVVNLRLDAPDTH